MTSPAYRDPVKRTAAGTADRQPEGPSVLWLLTKWVLLRLWARPTIAAFIVLGMALAGMVLQGRWWLALILIGFIVGAYFADRIWFDGRILRSYRDWAAVRAATYKVKFQWDDLMDDLRLSAKYPSGYIERPIVRRVDHVNGAVVVKFDSLRTQHLGDFEGNAERFRTAFGGLRIAFRELAPGRYEMRITKSDPLADGVTATPAAMPPVREPASSSSLLGVDIGTLDTGRPMTVPFDQNHSLFGGIPGSGKSVALNVAMAGLAYVPHVQIVGIDCKYGIEFKDWEPRLSALGTDQKTALDVLKDVERMAIARAKALADSGFRKQADKGYTPEEPLWVVVIDECAELFDTSTTEAKKLSGELVGLVSRLVRVTGRSGGVSVVLATQKPTTDSIPSIIRDNVSYRVGFRCKTPEQARAIFGESAAGSVSPTSISADQKGYCVVEDANANFIMGRSAFISAESVRQIASLASPLRRPLSDFVPPEPESEDDE